MYQELYDKVKHDSNLMKSKSKYAAPLVLREQINSNVKRDKDKHDLAAR